MEQVLPKIGLLLRLDQQEGVIVWCSDPFLKTSYIDFSKLIITRVLPSQEAADSKSCLVHEFAEVESEGTSYIITVPQGLQDNACTGIVAVCLSIFGSAYVIGDEVLVEEVQNLANDVDSSISIFQLEASSYDAFCQAPHKSRRVHSSMQTFKGFFDLPAMSANMRAVFLNIQKSVSWQLLIFRRDKLNESIKQQPLLHSQMIAQSNRILAEQFAESHKDTIDGNIKLIERFNREFAVSKGQNALLSNSICSQLILQEFKYFEKKKELFNSFEEYEDDINLFYNYYMEICPEFENKKLIILEFLTKVLKESAKHFIQLAVLKRLHEGDQSTEMHSRSMSFQDQDYYQGIIESSREQIKSLQFELQQSRMNFETNLEKVKAISRVEVEELTKQLNGLKNSGSEKDNYIAVVEQEKSILQQKVDYLEFQLKEVIGSHQPDSLSPGSHEQRNNFHGIDSQLQQNAPDFDRFSEIRKELDFKQLERNLNQQQQQQQQEQQQQQLYQGGYHTIWSDNHHQPHGQLAYRNQNNKYLEQTQPQQQQQQLQQQQEFHWGFGSFKINGQNNKMETIQESFQEINSNNQDNNNTNINNNATNLNNNFLNQDPILSCVLQEDDRFPYFGISQREEETIMPQSPETSRIGQSEKIEVVSSKEFEVPSSLKNSLHQQQNLSHSTGVVVKTFSEELSKELEKQAEKIEELKNLVEKKDIQIFQLLSQIEKFPASAQEQITSDPILLSLKQESEKATQTTASSQQTQEVEEITRLFQSQIMQLEQEIDRNRRLIYHLEQRVNNQSFEVNNQKLKNSQGYSAEQSRIEGLVSPPSSADKKQHFVLVDHTEQQFNASNNEIESKGLSDIIFNHSEATSTQQYFQQREMSFQDHSSHNKNENETHFINKPKDSSRIGVGGGASADNSLLNAFDINDIFKSRTLEPQYSYQSLQRPTSSSTKQAADQQQKLVEEEPLWKQYSSVNEKLHEKQQFDRDSAIQQWKEILNKQQEKRKGNNNNNNSFLSPVQQMQQSQSQQQLFQSSSSSSQSANTSRNPSNQQESRSALFGQQPSRDVLNLKKSELLTNLNQQQIVGATIVQTIETPSGSSTLIGSGSNLVDIFFSGKSEGKSISGGNTSSQRNNNNDNTSFKQIQEKRKTQISGNQLMESGHGYGQTTVDNNSSFTYSKKSVNTPSATPAVSAIGTGSEGVKLTDIQKSFYKRMFEKINLDGTSTSDGVESFKSNQFSDKINGFDKNRGFLKTSNLQTNSQQSQSTTSLLSSRRSFKSVVATTTATENPTSANSFRQEFGALTTCNSTRHITPLSRRLPGGGPSSIGGIITEERTPKGLSHFSSDNSPMFRVSNMRSQQTGLFNNAGSSNSQNTLNSFFQSNQFNSVSPISSNKLHARSFLKPHQKNDSIKLNAFDKSLFFNQSNI